MLINTGNISRKVLPKVLRSFDKNFERLQKAKTFEVKWKKDKKASGYIIEYSTDKKFKKNVKKNIVSKNKTVSKKITKLKPGKKYYVRVCTYKNSHGKKVQGDYSKVRTVKIRK